MFPIRRLTPIAFSIAFVVVMATPLSVAAAPPAGWGWVVARHATSASYIPAAKDQGNSSGLTNHVERQFAGHYRVFFPGANSSDGGGHVQVSAMNAAAIYCNVLTWGTGATSSDITADVGCFVLNGTNTDSAFTAVFLTRGYNSGTIAYAWANNETATDYTPSTFYQSSGGSVTIHRAGSGDYAVRFPGFDANHGNVQVTGYGDLPCKVKDVTSDSTAMIVGVLCPLGDAEFNVLYTKNVGLTGVARPKAAYLHAVPLATGANRLPAAFRYSTAGTTPTLTRTSVGKYVVTLPGMPKGGVVHVTAGFNSVYLCNVRKIRTTGTPQKVGVSCINTNSGGSPGLGI